MKIEKNFNRKVAELIDVQPPSINIIPSDELAIKLMFFRLPNDTDRTTISMRMTPSEALAFAARLVDHARIALKI